MRFVLIGLLYLAVCLHAAADECTDDMSINRCVEGAVLGERGFTAEVVSATQAKVIAESQPGADSGGNQTRSTVTDLIPWLNMLGVLSDSDASDGTIAVDLNFLLPFSGPDVDHNAQLKWIIDIDPEPFVPLIEAFPQAVRTERKSEFSDELGETADTELQFSWSLVNGRFGRDMRQHHDEMAAMIFPVIQPAYRASTSTARRQYLAQAAQVLADIDDDLADGFDNMPLKDLNLTPEQLANLKATLVVTAAQIGAGQKAAAAEITRQLAQNGLDRLPELVLAQPQLLLTATRRFREELAGPDAWGARLTYEHSFANLGHFLRGPGTACRATNEAGAAASLIAAPTLCYAALTRYLQAHEADLANENRFSASLEYRRVDSTNFSFAQDGVTLDIPKTDRLIASLGYGRVLPRSAAKDRLDVKIDYDSNIDDTSAAQNRFVASLTYTRRIGDFDMPFGIVYANKSEFLEGLDKQVSVHVGLKFRTGSSPK